MHVTAAINGTSSYVHRNLFLYKDINIEIYLYREYIDKKELSSCKLFLGLFLCNYYEDEFVERF